MLKRRRPISAVAVLALAVLAPIAAAASAATRQVVFVANGGPPLVRPSTLYASPTNGPYAKGLTWEDWGEGRATAEGIVYYDTCDRTARPVTTLLRAK